MVKCSSPWPNELVFQKSSISCDETWNSNPKKSETSNQNLCQTPASSTYQLILSNKQMLLLPNSCVHTAFVVKAVATVASTSSQVERSFALWPNRVGLWKIFSCPISTLSTLTHMTALLSWTPANGCDFYCGRYEQLDRFQIQYAEVYKQYGWGWGQNPAKCSSNSRSCPACCEYHKILFSLLKVLGNTYSLEKISHFPKFVNCDLLSATCIHGVLQLSGIEATARFQGLAKQS